METEQMIDQAQGGLSKVIDKLMAWLEAGIALLPNLVVSIVVLFSFALLARLLGSLVSRGLKRTSSNGQVTSLVLKAIRMSVFATGLFVALGVLGLDKTVSSLLAGVGILGLAIGFAFQDVLANFMSGILLAFRKPFELGDLIRTSDVMGNVERTGLSATVVRTFQGQLVWIPNKNLLEGVLTNYTHTGERRIEVDVGVSYGDDLDLAERTCRKALESLSFRHPNKDVDVWFTGFGSSSIDISARVWIDLRDASTNFLHARSELVKALKSAFDSAGLTIPFPIRTLDFGITGGEELREHLTVLRGGNGHDAGADGASSRSDVAAS